MKRLICLPFALIFQCSFIYGQASNDAGLWATFNLDKKLSKRYSLFLTEEYRLRENFSQTNLFYTDLGAEVRPAKFIKVSLAYRSIQKNIYDNPYSYRHRLMCDITLKKKMDDFIISYRHRFQEEVRNVYSSKNGIMPESYSRNKFEIKYESGKSVSPYVAAEFRYQFHNPRSVESDYTWHRNRYSFGFDYRKSEKTTLGLYYLIQQEFNVSAPQNLYILGLEYSLSI